jgi:hypothetical protein
VADGIPQYLFFPETKGTYRRESLIEHSKVPMLIFVPGLALEDVDKLFAPEGLMDAMRPSSRKIESLVSVQDCGVTLGLQDRTSLRSPSRILKVASFQNHRQPDWIGEIGIPPGSRQSDDR